MELSEGIKWIFEGESLLFVGSGFSLGAENSNPLNREMKKAGELSDLMLHAIGLSRPEYPLGKSANLYIRELGPDSLVDFLKQEFQVSKTTPEQDYLSSFAWHRVYSTNYDNVVESAYAKSGKTCTSVTLSDDCSAYAKKSNLVVHLNGYINTLTPNKLNNEFKLTNLSYLASDFEQSGWLELFKNDIRVCRSIFFVGFSMDYDLDLTRIIASTGIQDKAFFVVSDKFDALDTEILSDFGTVLPIGVTGLVSAIKNESKTYVHNDAEGTLLRCFCEMTLNKHKESVYSKDFYELILSGLINENFVKESLNNSDFKYVARRSALDVLRDKLSAGAKSILVESALGNGKTIFLYQVASLLLSENYPVFWYERYSDSVFGEIQYIIKHYSNAIFILDDYHTAKDIIRSIRQLSSSHVIITSERQSYHDAVYEEVIDVLGAYQTVSVDIMSKSDCSLMDALLDRYSMWGDMSAKSMADRMPYIQNYCKSQISLLILSRVRSASLTKKLLDAYGQFSLNKDYRQAFIVLVLIELFRFKVDMLDLGLLMGNGLINDPVFRNNSGIREFIGKDGDLIRFKSSIISKYIMLNILDSQDVLDTLIEMAKRLDKTISINKNHKSIFTSMMNFTQLRNCVEQTRSGALAHVLRFYEETSTLPSCKSNIHFWLQYAIARLTEKNYPIALKYFEKCYALANAISGYATYKIDNHFCRYLLENEIENGRMESCMDAFKRAHAILINTSIGDEKLFYPYRMAALYFDFYKKFYTYLTDAEKKDFLSSCSDMRQKCVSYLANNKDNANQRIVQDTERKLSRILKENGCLALNSSVKFLFGKNK